MAGGLAGRRGKGSLELGKCRGLIAGASLRPDPGISSGDAGGNGRARLAIPSPSSLGREGFAVS